MTGPELIDNPAGRQEEERTPHAGRAHPGESAAAHLLLPEVHEFIEQSEYHELRRLLEELAPADVADLIDDLMAEYDRAEGAIAFRLLRRDEAADVFSELGADEQADLIEQLGADRAVRLVESMDADDRAAFLEEMPAEAATRLIAQLSPEERQTTQAILGYAPDSIGRLMTPDYVRVKPGWTVAHSLDHIRRYGKDAETVHWVFVVDLEGRLIDDLHIRTLLLADPEALIESLMDDRFVALSATEDREEAVYTMNRYDRTAMPVVDTRGLLLGIVTHDDIADVAEEEATEDIQKLGGMEALERPYMQTRVLGMLKKRAGWLIGLFLVQVLTIGVMGYFDQQLEAALVLALFIPMIISAGGNTGTQAASLLIRAIALHELERGDWQRVLGKEMVTGAILGLVLGALGMGVVMSLHALGFAETLHAPRVALTIGLSVLGIVLWAVVIGSMFPIVLDRMGLDPATISSPLVATLMDVSGLLIYFGVAMIVLRGTLL
ncbi:MAG: magnesium transporter [Planctomycetota bacterium]